MSDNVWTPAAEDELTPQAATVIPRGHRLRGEASLPIDRMLLPVIRGKSRGIVFITAPPGGGKTTALRHLRAVLPTDAQVPLFDAHQAADAKQAAASRIVVLAGVDPQPHAGFVDVIVVSSWTLDDCLEYLVARHREACASILERLRNDQSLSNSRGSPQFLTLAMDAMACDPSLRTSWEIVRHRIHQIIPPGMALDRLILDGPLHAPLSTEQWRWWRHEEVRRICYADWIAGQLCEGLMPKQLYNMDHGAPLVPDIAAAVRHQPRAIVCLERFLVADRQSSAAPMAASVLLAADPNWRPSDGLGLNLNLWGALLSGARWSGLNLSGSALRCAHLAGADLSGANLCGAAADCADLSGANLHGARLEKTCLVNADLKSTNLSNVSASRADFSEANLEGANLRQGIFRRGRFVKTSMSNVQSESADFSGALLSTTTFDQANFAGAKFSGAKLQHLDMTAADWTAAVFTKSEFIKCNLEGLHMAHANFDGADLSGCLLTASTIPGGKFRGANLSQTGLADIDW